MRLDSTFDWHGFIKRVSFRQSLAIEVSIREIHGRPMLFVTLHAPDIHTSEPTTVHRSEILPPVESEREAAWFVRQQILGALEHEVDECLMLDGTQCIRPHITTGECCPVCGDKRQIRMASRSWSVSRDERYWECCPGDDRKRHYESELRQ